jgi:hypothetical protein
MPSKIQLDENLWFLFICLQKSDYKSVSYHFDPYPQTTFDVSEIDFNAVGTATNLKPPAARMRYTRLRRQIESGTLIGTHGTPFAGGADKIAKAMRKRKKSIQVSGDADSGPGKVIDSQTMSVKFEEDESDFETGSEYSDSEDDVPLAKRRGALRNSKSVCAPLRILMAEAEGEDGSSKSEVVSVPSTGGSVIPASALLTDNLVKSMPKSDREMALTQPEIRSTLSSVTRLSATLDRGLPVKCEFQSQRLEGSNPKAMPPLPPVATTHAQRPKISSAQPRLARGSSMGGLHSAAKYTVGPGLFRNPWRHGSEM